MNLNAHGDAFIVDVSFSGTKQIQVEALVDTGAETSFLDEEICQDVGLNLDGATGINCIHGERKNMPVFKGKVKVAGRTIESRIVAIPSSLVILPGTNTKAIIGRNILGEFIINLDGPCKKGSIL